MALPTQPQVLSGALGYNAPSGDVSTIPQNTPEGEGIPSIERLFPSITAVNPTAGGKMIERSWMNGLFNLIGQHLFWLQTGAGLPWQASLDYPVGSHVLGSDGIEYVCITACGAALAPGSKNPANNSNPSYWAQVVNTNSNQTITGKKTFSQSINANIDGSAARLGDSDVGSGVTPFYLSSGTATASTSSVGGTNTPVRLLNGEITALSGNAGNISTPAFMENGQIKSCSASVGSSSIPVYMSNGTFSPCTNLTTVPVGGLIMLATMNIPDGYLPCLGQWLDKIDYSRLYSAIGNLWGVDGNNFRLPNFLGRVPWGNDSSGGYINAGLPNITGSIGNWDVQSGCFANGAFYVSQRGNYNDEGGTFQSNFVKTISFNASRSSAIYGNSSTVQPPAVRVIFAIKY